VYYCTTHQEEKTSFPFTLYRTPRRINFLLFFFLFLFTLRFFGFPHFTNGHILPIYRKQNLTKKQAQLLLQVSSMSLSSCRSKLLLQVKPCAPSNIINFFNNIFSKLFILSVKNLTYPISYFIILSYPTRCFTKAC
jgi:hypothetical protein